MIVQFKGADIKGILKRIQKDLVDDSSALLDLVAEKVVLPSIEKNFKEEGRPNKWEALRPKTMRIRKFLGYGESHPILVRDGELKSSATNKKSRDMEYDLGKKQLVMTNMLAKAPALHFGDDLIPARPFFMIQKEDTKLAQKQGIKYIQKELNRYKKEEVL